MILVGFDSEEGDILELYGGEGFWENALGAELLEIVLGEEGHATVDLDTEDLAAKAVGEFLGTTVEAAGAEHHNIVADVVEKDFKHWLSRI